MRKETKNKTEGKTRLLKGTKAKESKTGLPRMVQEVLTPSIVSLYIYTIYYIGKMFKVVCNCKNTLHLEVKMFTFPFAKIRLTRAGRRAYLGHKPPKADRSLSTEDSASLQHSSYFPTCLLVWILRMQDQAWGLARAWRSPQRSGHYALPSADTSMPISSFLS